jgi:hypothetical protein
MSVTQRLSGKGVSSFYFPVARVNRRSKISKILSRSSENGHKSISKIKESTHITAQQGQKTTPKSKPQQNPINWKQSKTPKI